MTIFDTIISFLDQILEFSQIFGIIIQLLSLFGIMI